MVAGVRRMWAFLRSLKEENDIYLYVVGQVWEDNILGAPDTWAEAVS